MSTGDNQARRGTGWEAMRRTLAADAVVAEALLYASGGRRLTVEHGQPLTDQAGALVQRLVDDVDQAAAAAGYLGGGTVTSRATSISWTFRPTTSPPASWSSRFDRLPTGSTRAPGSSQLTSTTDWAARHSRRTISRLRMIRARLKSKRSRQMIR